jgi:hypothetical protein
MLDPLLSNSLNVAVIWAAMYIFDFASTFWLAGAYRDILSKYNIYEGGVELNPVFEKEIARRQKINLKFLAALVIYFLVILFSIYVGRLFLEFIAGALLLTWLFIDLRHLRNYGYVGLLRRKPDAIKTGNGPNTLSYWVLQRLISLDAINFSLLCLLLAILTFRLFFLGGMSTCLALALRHWRLANRKSPLVVPGESQAD